MAEDPAAREAAFERLEDGPGELGSLVDDICAILQKSNLLFKEQDIVQGAVEQIVSAKGDEERVEALRDVFFAEVQGEGKYLEMLSGLAMEQVADRILEDRQAAVASRDQTDKLKQRLHELKRARAAHELQKQKREKKRARQAEMAELAGEVPEGLYELPGCAVCAKVPDTADFLQCPACAVLVSWKVREKPVVYCCAKHAEDVCSLGYRLRAGG